MQPQHAGVTYSPSATDSLIITFQTAAFYNKQQLIDRVKSLLAKGANPNAIWQKNVIRDPFGTGLNYTITIGPLEEAIELNKPELVKLLLEAGANQNMQSNNDTPILIRTLYNNAIYRNTIAALLISYGANISESLAYVTRDASTPQNHRAFNFLIKQTPDVNYYGNSNNTPLLSATENRDLLKMRALLEAGADPNLVSKDFQYTPLMEAVANKDVAAIQLLLENGARTDIKNKYGQTALDMALKGGAGEEIELLLRNPPPVKKLGLKKTE
jgi:ankyrin repeat protein